VLNGRSAKLFDVQSDPTEEHNLIDSDDRQVISARQRLEAVIRRCDPRDARPRYTPTPPQPWDRKPTVPSEP
jgi:hypothetical protein